MTPPPRIAAILSLVQGPRILDLGCCNNAGVPINPEAWPYWLHGVLCKADENYSVIGGDINRTELQKMQEKNYNVMYLDAENIPPDGETFDTIVAGELIEHLSNPGKFLDGCRTRLVPGGQLVISTPNPWSLQWFLQYCTGFDHAFNIEHTAWIDPQTLNQLLARHGFRVERRLFVDDLRPGGSRPYQLFTRLWRIVGRVTPRRFRNTQVILAIPSES